MWHLHRNVLHDRVYDCVLVSLFLYLDVAGNESTFIHFSMYASIFSIMYHTVCLLAVKDISL